jgi:uncharacterized repeat protein (TIGR03803 family)
MISEGQSNSSPGAVFRIARAGYGFATIFDFSIDNGEKPLGFPVIFDSIVYGMTSRGGPDSAGVVFRMELNGLFFNLLKTFNTAEPGRFPQGSLVNDSSTFYGMARGATPESGCIFKINSEGKNYSLLYQFQDANNGYYPDGSMLFYGKKLWGMTERGGAVDSGVIFTYSLIAQSVQDMNNLPEVTIFPNPASDYTRITSSKEIITLTLSDMNGRIILEQDHPGKSATITTSGLPVGIYFVRITGRDYTVTRKIVRE